MNSSDYFELAINDAMVGLENKDGAPFGACIVSNGNKILALAHDTVLKDNDATCHAEMNAIRMASKILKTHRLESCEIYCTSEPCPMCLAAIHWAGIKVCYFIADKTVAASFGFDDQVIYEELSKPFVERRMKIIQETALNDRAVELFKVWQQKELPVC